MYTPHTYCRACGYASPGASGIKSNITEKLLPVFDLGLQPLANDFTKENEERSGFAPLQVLFCPRCTLGQLSVVVRPDILYRHYHYVTSPSETMRRHFDALYDCLSQEQPFRSVLEIGSNDGAFLLHLARMGNLQVAGIDPAENLAEIARRNGVPTIADTFSTSAVERVLPVSPGGFDLIVARHVFCHVDDWPEFISALGPASHEETLVAIEVPYSKDLLERGEFDTIYHEHLSYLTLRSVHALLKDSNWQLQNVVRFPIHGGAIVLLLRRKHCGYDPDPAVEEMTEKEQITGETWQTFARQARSRMDQLVRFLNTAKQENKRVAALGASAKSTVWINACLLTRKDIAFISDATMQKQWKFSPGSDIPIVDEGAILRDLPDYVICFAWNFRDEIVAKNQAARSQGVRLVFPIPVLEVV